MDSNGKLDGGTLTGFEGWKITLYGKDGVTKVDETITGENGSYKFENLKLGEYVLVEEARDGYGSVDGKTTLKVTLDKGGMIFGDDPGEITDFINYKKVSVGGAKLIDRDNNISTSADQKPGAGWTIELYEDKGSLGIYDDADVKITSVTTGIDGKFSFTDLDPGRYLVKEVQQTGYTAIDKEWIAVDLTNGGTEITGANIYNKPDICYEGLTPGFWRQSQNWSKVTMTSEGRKFFSDLGVSDLNKNGSIDFSDVMNTKADALSYKEAFGVPDSVQGVSLNISFLQAIQLDGNADGVQALVRHSTAALLNSVTDKHQGAKFDFFLPLSEVTEQTQAAIKTNSTTAMIELKNDFAALNELGVEGAAGYLCPLAGDLKALFDNTKVGLDNVFA